ncbi:acetyl-CoA carboxylase biotin carboxyl carrier protein [Verrucomicrobia bacterium S94]|nr:acetyl-CoA carboxylase biotin carboxyl carrier protein [Verrucomicrobia bacterium S94]
MEIKDIKRIVELMKANELTEFSMKDNDFELAMKRGGEETVVYAAPPAAPVGTAPVAAAAVAPAEAAPAVDENEGLVEIPSPIVGTFYRKPAPDADNFADVGMEVTEDTVVCIVEAMKVMNEIKAEVKGIIRKVLVDDASPVQYGQPLFLVEPK